MSPRVSFADVRDLFAKYAEARSKDFTPREQLLAAEVNMRLGDLQRLAKRIENQLAEVRPSSRFSIRRGTRWSAEARSNKKMLQPGR
jgi:hypothetical protein